jgi:tight adherence protein B
VVPTLVFIAVVSTVFVAQWSLQRFSDRDQRRVRKRLKSELKTEDTPSAPAARPLFQKLQAIAHQETRDTASETKADAAASLRARWKTTLLRWAADYRFRTMWPWSLACALTTALPAGFFLGWPAYVVGLVVGAAIPFLILRQRRESRRERFLRQLAPAFDLMARIIRAGQSVPQALHAVAEAFEEPLSAEFESCRHQQNLGVRPEVTYQEMADRAGIIELRIFVMAMAIQRRSGGNLSETLDRLAALVRARLRLRDQVRTFTAEGRLQGATLLVLPFVVFGILMVVNREYASKLLDQPGLIGVTLGAMTLGAIWIRRIVRFEY